MESQVLEFSDKPTRYVLLNGGMELVREVNDRVQKIAT
jgi:hypothetical protein